MPILTFCIHAENTSAQTAKPRYTKTENALTCPRWAHFSCRCGSLLHADFHDAVLYLVASDGRIQCAKPQGFPYLRREAFATARARMGLSPAKIKRSIEQRESAGVGGGLPSDVVRFDDPLRSRQER